MLCCLTWEAGSEVIIHRDCSFRQTPHSPSTRGYGRALCPALASKEYQTKAFLVCLLEPLSRYSFAVTGSWLQENVQFPDGNVGAFWAALKFSVPVYLQLKEVFHACSCRTPLYCPVLIQIIACICSKAIKRLLRIVLNKLNALLTTLKFFLDFISQLL